MFLLTKSLCGQIPQLLYTGTFVANRVAEIQRQSDVNQWRNVRSNDNPADFLSRGELPNEFIKNDQWIHHQLGSVRTSQNGHTSIYDH